MSRCEPCGLTFTSAAQLADHEKGKKHALKMRWLARCEENPLKAKLGMKHTKTYTCLLCGISHTSFNLMKEHKAGKAHKLRQRAEDGDKAAIGILRKRKLLDEKATDPQTADSQEVDTPAKRAKVEMAKPLEGGGEDPSSDESSDSSSDDSSSGEEAPAAMIDPVNESIAESTERNEAVEDDVDAIAALEAEQAEIAAQIAAARLAALEAKQAALAAKLKRTKSLKAGKSSSNGGSKGPSPKLEVRSRGPDAESVPESRGVDPTAVPKKAATVSNEVAEVRVSEARFSLSKAKGFETRTELRVRKLRELRAFLLAFREAESRGAVVHMPPQSSDDRKLTHSVAEELRLSHVSAGSGKGRHIVCGVL
jgi:hypothetical protein